VGRVRTCTWPDARAAERHSATLSGVMRTVIATRYVTPLREGGSLPGLVEADDDGLYVVKFRGAGQGPRALVAEWLAGELAREIGLAVPDLVAVEVDPALGDAEPDEEIHDLVDASGGLNLGMDFLPGALSFNPAAATAEGLIDPTFAADVVWLDALVTNPDRTAQNPNLLVWHGRPWLRLGLAERFHWLVAPSSTIIQPSDVHTGLCDDPAAELDHLMATLVDRWRGP